MSLRLENKNALVTGGASGIGRATSIRFAEEGANLFVADRHLAAAEETAAAVRKAIAHQVDTSEEAQVNAMVERMVKELGGVDIVVAAAGVPNLITVEMVKPGAAVLDVGVSRAADGSIAGDVAKDVREVAGFIAPNPGGVGPMTRAMLLTNVVEAAERIAG